MFARLRAFFWQDFETAFGRELTPIENWSLANANKCSADDIIAASIVQSFAKDFDDWTGDFPEIGKNRIVGTERDLPDTSAKLINQKKDITIETGRWIKGKSRDNDGVAPFYFSRHDILVNGVVLEANAVQVIDDGYHRIKRQVERTKEAAAKAKADMENNEAAWNLAEKLLGMKRNEFGGLVPVKTVE